MHRHLCPEAELVMLEPRLTLSFNSTYVWTALGDRMSWSDANNWSHFGPEIGIPLTGTPTAKTEHSVGLDQGLLVHFLRPAPKGAATPSQGWLSRVAKVLR